MSDSETAAILRRAKARISDPAHWCQGQMWKGEAACAQAAVHEASPDSMCLGSDALRLLYETIPSSAPRMSGIGCYNDAPTTTHADILAWFDRAIALAEADS